MLREAASRLQQKIQKHLLDSEDGKVLDDTRDKTVSMEYQVKSFLRSFHSSRLKKILKISPSFQG